MALFSRREQTGIETSDDTPNGTFLGTLRSELDEDAPLEGAFAELYARFITLHEAYDAGRVETRSFGRALRDLRVIDAEGYQWTIGATTGRWYRRNQQEGGRWMSAPAPVGTGTLVDHSGKASGWAVEDWEERRARRLREDAERARAEEVKRESAPESKRKMTIEEMFDKYVETVENADEFSVGNSILAVENLPEFGVLGDVD